MNIVHVITGLGQGGAESMLEKLILTSLRDSPDVSHRVVSLLDLGIVGPRLQAAGIPVVALGLGGVGGTLRGLVRLYRELRRVPRDSIVQTWLYHGDLLGGLASRLSGHRRVHWNLRCFGRMQDYNPATALIVRLCAVYSGWLPQRIVSCGPATLQSHVALGYAADRGVVIGNGFDSERFRRDDAVRRQMRRALGFADDELVIGTVGRIDPLKGYPTLAAAAAQVVAQRRGTRFLWVGQGVDTDPALTAQVHGLGLDPSRLTRLGLRRDIPDLMRSMDVYCLASDSEGFPNVLGEAMASELPCVSTDAGDAGYLLGDDRWLVPVRSPSALAQALLRVCDLDADSRRLLGAANRSRVTTSFGMHAVWKRYLALYRHGDPDGPPGG
jgi:glycosyltransferase involved in cell wall biosynthesis